MPHNLERAKKIGVLTLSMTKSQEILASIMFIGRWVIALLRSHFIPSHFRSLGCVITLIAVPSH